MKLLVLRLLFFGLVPIGIFIFIKGIRLIRKAFNGKVLLSIPYLQNDGQFSVTKAGQFSVSQKGPIFKRTPIDKFKMHIYETSTNKELKLQFSLLRPHKNDFSTARVELFRFYASEGNYKIAFKEGSNIPKLESVIGNIMPLPTVDLSKYFIEIRESQSQIITFLAILIILLGIGGAIGGFVLGLLADAII